MDIEVCEIRHENSVDDSRILLTFHAFISFKHLSDVKGISILSVFTHIIHTFHNISPDLSPQTERHLYSQATIQIRISIVKSRSI